MNVSTYPMIFAARPALDLKRAFLAVQFIGLFIALLFAAGGGEMPGRIAGNFIYIKAFLFALPLTTIGLLFLIHPRRVLWCTGNLIRENRLWLLYMTFCFFSIPLAVDWAYSLNRILYMCFGTFSVLATVMSYNIFYPDTKTRQHVFASHLRVLALISLVFVFYLLVRSVIEGSSVRNALANSFPLHPNIFASFLAHLFLWYFCHWAMGHRMGAGLMLGLAVSVTLMFSRSVFGCLVVSMAAISCFSLVWYGRRDLTMAVLTVLALALMVLIVVVSGVVSIEEFIAPVLRDHQSIENFMTMTNRTDLWQIILSDLDLKKVLVGNGYSVIVSDFRVDFGTGMLYGAHNAYLSIFLGNGILALGAFLLWLMWNFMRMRYIRYFQNPAVVMATLGSLVLLMFNSFVEEQVGVATSAVLAYILLVTNLYGRNV